MSRSRSTSPQNEREPLLPGPAHTDGSGASVMSEQAFDKQRMKRSWDPVSRLDVVPSRRDRLAGIGVAFSGSTDEQAGVVLFLGGTWYLVLSQNLKALGYFAPHPILNSLAITLIILGILPIQPPPASTLVRAERFKTHQGLILGVAMPVLALGSASMWWNKHVHGAQHFTTWHSWCGLTAIGWILLQSLLGFLAIHSPNLFGGPAKARQVYKYHRLSGYILITLLLVTAHLGGAHSTWALGLKGDNMRDTRILAFWIGAPVLLVATMVRMSKMQFK